MPNNENRDENQDKLLTYLKGLHDLHKEDNHYIRSLVEAFNYGRPPKEQAHSLQSLATFMVKDESTFERVMYCAKRLLPATTFATFQVNIGVAQEAALVRDFMHPLPKESFFPPTATVADLVRFFEGIVIPRYFVVTREGTGELVGMISISDYSPKRDEIKSRAHDTLVTRLQYFRREVETLRDTDTMDLAQQRFEKHPTLQYLFVVNETRHPIGLLSKEDDLERWRTSRLG